MLAVSASSGIVTLSSIRAAAATDQNTTERVCETGILSGASHGRYELGQLRFNSSAKLAGTRNGRVGAALLVRSVDRISR